MQCLPQLSTVDLQPKFLIGARYLVPCVMVGSSVRIFLFWIDGTNLTVHVDSHGGGDQNKLSTLQIEWLAEEGGFVTENCENLDGLFDMCSEKMFSKVKSTTPKVWVPSSLLVM